MITKTPVVFVLIVISICSFNVADVEASNYFDTKLALLALKSRQDQSMLVSTLAVKFPLCKLASIAETETKNELMSALGFSSFNSIKNYYKSMKAILKKPSERELVLVEKIYYDAKSEINQEFLNQSSEEYGVQIDGSGFEYPRATVGFINRMIEILTFKRIEDVLANEDVDRNTTLIIVTAAHYKLSWQNNFDISMTSMTRFTHLNKSTSLVPMMTVIATHQCMESKEHEFKMLHMLLASYGVSISFIVPNKTDGLPDLLRKLEKDPTLLQKARNELKDDTVRIYIPRIKIKSCLEWSEHLKQVGVNRIFNSNTAGLDAIMKKTSKPIHVGKIKQKNFIEIDEYGIHFPDRSMKEIKYYEALFDRHDVVVEHKAFKLRADHPFLFTVNIHGGQDTAKQSGTDEVSDYLFTGVYYGPE